MDKPTHKVLHAMLEHAQAQQGNSELYSVFPQGAIQVIKTASKIKWRFIERKKRKSRMLIPILGEKDA